MLKIIKSKKTTEGEGVQTFTSVVCCSSEGEVTQAAKLCLHFNKKNKTGCVFVLEFIHVTRVNIKSAM